MQYKKILHISKDIVHDGIRIFIGFHHLAEKVMKNIDSVQIPHKKKILGRTKTPGIRRIVDNQIETLEDFSTLFLHIKELAEDVLKELEEEDAKLDVRIKEIRR